jgi:hypothetical protein
MEAASTKQVQDTSETPVQKYDCGFGLQYDDSEKEEDKTSKTKISFRRSRHDQG